MSQRLDGATKDFEWWLFNALKIGNRHIHLKLSFTKKNYASPPLVVRIFLNLLEKNSVNMHFLALKLSWKSENMQLLQWHILSIQSCVWVRHWRWCHGAVAQSVEGPKGPNLGQLYQLTWILIPRESIYSFLRRGMVVRIFVDKNLT